MGSYETVVNIHDGDHLKLLLLLTVSVNFLLISSVLQAVEVQYEISIHFSHCKQMSDETK